MAPPLWVVTAGKAQVHLFGQAPWGVRDGDRWFAGAPDAAFESSREFWCEVPDDPRLTDGELVLRFGLSGTPLSATVGDTALVRLREAAHVVNVDVASLERCRPWLAAQLLDAALRGSADQELVNAEAVLTERARVAAKRVAAEFQDAEHVLSYFASLGPAEVEYLEWTIERVLGGRTALSRGATSWLSGDTAAFEADVESVKSAGDALYRSLLCERNHAWLPRFDRFVAGPDDVFVLMGMSHIVGDEGVLVLVRDRGYDVARVQ